MPASVTLLPLIHCADMLGSTNRAPALALVAVVFALIHPSRQVRASEEDDRRRLLEEIDDLLEDTAGDLDGFASESSTSDLDRAIDRTARVRDKARELERIQGDDSKARDVASRHPSYADRFRDAANSLRPLKEAQRALDDQP